LIKVTLLTPSSAMQATHQAVDAIYHHLLGTKRFKKLDFCSVNRKIVL